MYEHSNVGYVPCVGVREFMICWYLNSEYFVLFYSPMYLKCKVNMLLHTNHGHFGHRHCTRVHVYSFNDLFIASQSLPHDLIWLLGKQSIVYHCRGSGRRMKSTIVYVCFSAETSNEWLCRNLRSNYVAHTPEPFACILVNNDCCVCVCVGLCGYRWVCSHLNTIIFMLETFAQQTTANRSVYRRMSTG